MLIAVDESQKLEKKLIFVWAAIGVDTKGMFNHGPLKVEGVLKLTF